MLASYYLKMKKGSLIVLVVSLLLGLLGDSLLIHSTGQASLLEELNQQIQGAVNKQKDLEAQAQKYQTMVQEKRQEIANLNNQLSLMEAEINQLTNQIEITQNKIAQTNLEILKAQYEIEQKQAEISQQKEGLAEILRTVYRIEDTSLVEIILQNESFSDFFDHLVYLDNLQKQIQKKLNELNELKNQTEQYHQQQEAQRANLEDYKTELSGDKDSLETQRATREDLLFVTKGQEKEYQRLLAQIEAQKKELLGDIDRLRHERSQELSRLQAQQEKPQEGLASELWYFNQTDSRWASSRIGLSRSLIKDYGCAVTAVAMIFKYYGIDIDPGRLARERVFWYNLIVWPEDWQGVQLILNTKHQGVDWLRIDEELVVGHPVIIYIKAIGKGSGHYVVVHHKTNDGRYVVHDPYWGSNIYLSSSEALLAKLYNTKTLIDQMVIYH